MKKTKMYEVEFIYFGVSHSVDIEGSSCKEVRAKLDETKFDVYGDEGGFYGTINIGQMAKHVTIRLLKEPENYVLVFNDNGMVLEEGTRQACIKARNKIMAQNNDTVYDFSVLKE